jgi:hypothetical protein
MLDLFRQSLPSNSSAVPQTVCGVFTVFSICIQVVMPIHCPSYSIAWVQALTSCFQVHPRVFMSSAAAVAAVVVPTLQC